VISRRRFLRGVAPLGLTALGPSYARASTSQAFARAAAIVEDAVARGELPGAVLHVRRDGHVVGERAFGVKRVDGAIALAPDDVFWVASLTKPVVAAAVLQLAEARKLRVTDRVSEYLPEFSRPRVLVRYDPATETATTRPARREITLRDLLTHTAGIHHGHAEIDPVLGAIYRKAGVVFDSRLLLADKIARLGPLPLSHDPGARWTYGLSSDVLGRVVEAVAGVPLDQQLARAIFGPLDMRDSRLLVPPDVQDRLVTRYQVTDGVFRATPPDPHAAEARHLSGGGGLHTTVRDYAGFAQALLDDGGPILSGASIRAMTTNQIGALRAFGFRWGFSLAVSTDDAPGRPPLPRGFGWYGIFSTWFWVVPKSRTVVLLFSNVIRRDMSLPLFARVAQAVERP
jgi:CubicO group peptidase (beta-lactamase class C family)